MQNCLCLRPHDSLESFEKSMGLSHGSVFLSAADMSINVAKDVKHNLLFVMPWTIERKNNAKLTSFT